MVNAESLRLRRLMRWPIAGAVILLIALASTTKADPDLWGHLRTGLDTLQTHRLPSIDPYSFTQDRPLVYHEWLSELQMALAYAAGGSVGLTLLKGFLTLSALFVAWSALRGTELAARMVILGVVAIGTAGVTQTLRPQLWTLVCLAVLCRILTDSDIRTARWLPVLFAVWANVHGGWIVGFGVLVAWASGAVWSNPNQFRTWVALVGASGVATLCTPYGWTLWEYMFRTVRLTRPMIEDWQPLWHLPPSKWIPWMIAVGATIWATRRSDRNRLPVTLGLGMLAYASLNVARIEPLFCEAAAVLLAPVLVSRWPGRASPPTTGTRYDWLVAVGVFGVALTASGWIAATSLRCIAIDDNPAMPDAVAARLLASGQTGRLVTFFNWGEYALWHLGPRLRVSMDGRREAVYSDERLAEHDAILFGTPKGFDTLTEWRAEYIWLPATSTKTERWLAAHGYRIELETARSFVAVREDLPHLEAPPPAPASARACFPG